MADIDISLDSFRQHLETLQAAGETAGFAQISRLCPLALWYDAQGVNHPVVSRLYLHYFTSADHFLKHMRLPTWQEQFQDAIDTHIAREEITVEEALAILDKVNAQNNGS